MKKLLIVLLIELVAVTALASEDVFIKIGDIKGETEAVTNDGEETGTETKAVSPDRIEFKTATKELDKSSPLHKESTKTGTNPVYKARDAASGLPTGKRQHKPTEAVDPDSDDDSIETDTKSNER